MPCFPFNIRENRNLEKWSNSQGHFRTATNDKLTNIKKQKSMAHSKGKPKSTETVSVQDPIEKLLNKDFKTTVSKCSKN